MVAEVLAPNAKDILQDIKEHCFWDSWVACTFALREAWLIGPTLYEELGRKHRGLGIPPTMTSTTAASPSLGHAATADTLDHERFERSLSSSEGGGQQTGLTHPQR